MTTSPGQPRCAALVIIASHRRPCAVCKSPAATTKAGRRWRTGRSVYGNGTLTISHGSKIGIRLAIGLRRPLVEGRERVLDWPPIAFRQDHAIALAAVDEFVPRCLSQRCPHRSRDLRLPLAGQLARNHHSARCYHPLHGKEFPYRGQLPAPLL